MADLSTQAPVLTGSVTENLKIVHERMHQAFEGSPDIVRAVKIPRLVAVSKLKPKELIIEAYEAGQRYFGENYVQELLEKSTDPDILTQCPEINWHFIGHCQSSNVNKLLKSRNLALMETVSTSSLADKLQARCAKEEMKLNILVQVRHFPISKRPTVDHWGNSRFAWENVEYGNMMDTVLIPSA